MKIRIANTDRTEELEPRIRRAVEESRRHPNVPEFLPRDLASISLSDEANRDAYLDKLITLLWYRSDLDTTPPRISGGGGPLRGVIAWLRRLAWRFLRYQHDHTAFQQNVVNTQITATIEFIVESHRREVEDLQGRLDELEDRLRQDGGPEDRDGAS